MIVSFYLADLILISSASNLPSDCRYLNSFHDSSAETALLEFYDNAKPFTFKETNFFQPQCLLCEKLGGQVCFGYKGGTSYGIPSGTINAVRLITNLPYIYSLGENVGSLYTTVYAIATLREDLIIPYRTLLRFKGITTLDPIVSSKTVALRLCMICLANDINEYSLRITGDVYNLNVRLFINEIAINASNGINFKGNKRANINCRNRTVAVEDNSNIPDESQCSTGSCLGSEFCLTYQPEYAIIRETWCPLTEKKWISTPENSLKFSPSDSFLPLHIQIERILLNQKSFSLVLNPNWFIDYAGILTLSIPEATFGHYPDPIWKIFLPSTGRRPSNRRIILLYNCTDVQIRYNTSDSDYFQETIIFVDMKSNSTFTIKNNLDEAKRLCNQNVLVNVDDNTSITNQPQPSTTISNNDGANGSTSWKSTKFRQFIRFPCVILTFLYTLNIHFCSVLN